MQPYYSFPTDSCPTERLLAALTQAANGLHLFPGKKKQMWQFSRRFLATNCQMDAGNYYCYIALFWGENNTKQLKMMQLLSCTPAGVFWCWKLSIVKRSLLQFSLQRALVMKPSVILNIDRKGKKICSIFTLAPNIVWHFVTLNVMTECIVTK